MLRRPTPIVAALVFVLAGSAFVAGGDEAQPNNFNSNQFQQRRYVQMGGGDGMGGGGGEPLSNSFDNNQFQQRRDQQARPNDPPNEQTKAKKKKR